MTKTMVDVIHEHSKNGLRDGVYVCKAKGCRHVYHGSVGFPDALVVTAHVVNRLNAAGFGSRHDAWDAAADELLDGGERDWAHTIKERNPYPVTA